LINNKANIHENAIIDKGATIGARTNVWAFTHILKNARIGGDCNICDQVFIENEVVVGNRVTIKSGVQLWDGVEIEDDVFIGPNATFTNDRFPRSKFHLKSFPKTIIKMGASVGANATLLPGLTIGKKSMIGAGSVVTRDVPEGAIVIGNPAKIIGYVGNENDQSKVFSNKLEYNPEIIVSGVEIIKYKHVIDMRGNLTEVGLKRDLPFYPKRVFIIDKVPDSRVRGEHAHTTCHQCLVCLNGSVDVIVDDGFYSQKLNLSSPNIGLYMPPLIWGTQFNYSPDAILMVYASHEYDEKDYIRDYNLFLTEVKK